MEKTHDNVGNLHAGVVDIILNFNVLAREAQQAYKRIAQNRVAKVPDMRRLVGIDAGVFHQNFAYDRRSASGLRSFAEAKSRRPFERDQGENSGIPPPLR